jgi:adenine-specific DNA-methyltransferase
MTSTQKQNGQYFTVSDVLQNFIFEHVKYKNEPLLEPSFGAGHLLQKFKNFNEYYDMTCFEIDQNIIPILPFNEKQKIIYTDFLNYPINDKFKTIIGNPPYVKQKSGNNLYIQFIEKCYHLLDNNGEMLFIVPSDFMKLTSASSLINQMITNGSFTHFLFPHNENMFVNASIDIVIFRYEKNTKTNSAIVNGKNMFCNSHGGIITFSSHEIQGEPLSNMFHIYVGLVSGKDNVYRTSFGNVNVLVDKDKSHKFIYTDIFPTNNKEINDHLQLHKNELLNRKIKKFDEKNWFEWGAPRNKSKMEQYIHKPCIFIRNMTRNKEPAFIGNVQYFGGTLLCMIPKILMDSQRIDEIITFLNSDPFREEYTYAGRFKIGHKQLSNVILPFSV